MFKKFLTGGYPLWITFWGGIVVVIMTDMLVMQALNDDSILLVLLGISDFAPMALVGIYIMIGFAVLIATWQSADQYKGMSVWRILAKTSVAMRLLSIFKMVNNLM